MTAPLYAITIATRSLSDTLRFYGDGHGLKCIGPVLLDADVRQARERLWGLPPAFSYREFHLYREAVADAARLRVLAIDGAATPWRESWEPNVLGPYTIGFPNNRQRELDARLRALGFDARNPVEQTIFHHPDGRRWEILESLALAPDCIATVGIERGSGQPPIAALDVDGFGGPAYSMCVVENIERSAAVLQSILGYEIRNRRRQRSAGRSGAMNTPDGTEFEFAQCYPPNGRYGFLILIQFVNLSVQRPTKPPRLPHLGLVMYSFEVDDVDAVRHRASRCDDCQTSEPIALTDPVLGLRRFCVVVIPGGIALELFSQ